MSHTISATTQVRARIRESGFAFGPVTTNSYSRLGPDVQAFSSQLPILLIENFGQGNVPSKGWNQTGAGIQQVPRQSSAVTVFGTGGGQSTLTKPADLHSRSGIRVRGAFSTTFPEPQYSLETWDEQDADADVSVFGMAPESDWLLYAPNPNFDQTLMNNQFFFALANQMEVWAPQVQYVEAFLNTDGNDVTTDDYVGLYVGTEKVKRDPGRLEFARFAEDGSTGGWLLSINRMDPIPEDDPDASPQHFHTAGSNGVLQTSPNSSGQGDDIPRQYNAFINFEHPNGNDINATQRQTIEDWFQEMEDLLYGRAAGVAWNDPVDGYSKYIDVDNFIDYFIVHNLCKNSDGLLLSMWIYNPDPNNGGRLHFGPPWDYDLGSFEGSATSNLLHRSDRLWYARLFQDAAFVQRYQDRWQMWRQNVLSNSGMNQVFDDLVADIGNAALIRDGVSNLSSRIGTVKNWLAQRAAAIDAQFVQPPQFSQNGGEVATRFDLFLTTAFGDIYFTTDGSDPRLSNGSVSPNAVLFGGGSQSTTLLAPGSVWSYLDDGSNQGTAWNDPGFDDSAWAAGNAQLGYGDGDEATVVGFIDTDPGAGGVQKNFTTYFRSAFQVVDANAFTGATLRILRDDGAAVYINGTEVARSNMPGIVGDGTITYTTPASGTVSGSAESTLFLNILIDPSELVSGENTIAVEIHQSNAGSSDISFDLELLGTLATRSPLTLNQSTTVTARTRNGSEWSGVTQADFFVDVLMADSENLRISEVNYNPHDALLQYGDSNVDNDQFEFVELLNVSASDIIDLKGTAFATGIDFTFDDFTSLAPGDRILVVRDVAAFESRYGTGLNIAGLFQNETGLSNSGETIKLDDATGSTIVEFTYNDSGDWPDRADGPGSSLVVLDTEGDYNTAANWRASTAFGGTPGADAVSTTDVIVNEVLARTDLPAVDAVELYNTSGGIIDVSGWWLSDASSDYFKFQFAPGSTLVSGGDLVIDENDFNPGGGTNPTDFALSAAGDDVWHLESDGVGKPTRFADAVSFDATLSGVTLGRVPNGDPSHDLFPLANSSLGGPNGPHQPAVVIISEVHYHPSAPPAGSTITESELEFVELYNRSGSAIDLTDWRLRGGVDLDLPAGTILAAGEVLVLVSFDPNDAVLAGEFRTIHNVDASAVFIGP